METPGNPWNLPEHSMKFLVRKYKLTSPPVLRTTGSLPHLRTPPVSEDPQPSADLYPPSPPCPLELCGWVISSITIHHQFTLYLCESLISRSSLAQCTWVSERYSIQISVRLKEEPSGRECCWQNKCLTEEEFFYQFLQQIRFLSFSSASCSVSVSRNHSCTVQQVQFSTYQHSHKVLLLWYISIATSDSLS